MPVVMIDHGLKCREPTIVVEATLVNLLRIEERTERSGHIAPFGPSVGLKAVDADFFSRMQVVARFGEDRRHMAGGAFRSAGKERRSAFCRRDVVTAGRRFR